MHSFRFEPTELPPETAAIRADVRAFLAENLADYAAAMRSRSWLGIDMNFSRKFGQAGFLGMTFPKEYGGHGKTAFERYVMLEEVLAAGAPVGGHWMTDRQSGPLILKFGTEEMKQRIIPRIAKGEIFFCIGMSEPNSGSDLASIRTRAVRGDGGWVINGQKVWTTYAHKSHYMIALVRTGETNDDRHAGLSQFIVDLAAPGITVQPIRNMIGDEEFNEVIFDDAFVPDSMLVGAEGNGWQQVIAELAFERSGPDRFLSSFKLLTELIRISSEQPGERAAIAVGRLTAHLVTLRQMSLAVAAMLDAGAQPVVEATVVKDLGVAFEQSVPEIAHELIGLSPRLVSGSDFEKALAYVQQACVSFSLRGGTTEILRGVIARGLGLR